jgi:CRP-like cAMP-binding protein
VTSGTNRTGDTTRLRQGDDEVNSWQRSGAACVAGHQTHRMPEINVFRNSREAEVIPAGHVLFQEGEIGDMMFAVADGLVELTHGGAVIEKIGAGGIIGEMALIDEAPRSATATAATETRIIRVDRQHFVYLVQEHPTFALQVMSVMAERLRKANH